MAAVKKVLVDLERLRYPNSGIANVFRNLAKGLSNINSGLNISLYGPEGEIKKIQGSFRVHVRKALHKVLPFYTYPYHILHTSHQLSSYFHFKFPHQKKIVTLHDLNFIHEDVSEKKYNKELKKVRKNIENADVIVCISEFTKQDLLSNKDLFTFRNEPEIVVIHNGMQFPEDKTYNLTAFEFLKNKNYILNIGVLFPKKNQLSILKMLPNLDEDLVFVVSGEKPAYKAELEQFIHENNLKNRVHILKNISEEEKWALIQNCTSMCHPSLAEGFGIPPIEAMYFGKPVFLSDKTSLPEIGGEYANYFTSFDKNHMLEVYTKGMRAYQANQPTATADLKNWAKQYDFQVMAKNYSNLYQRL